MQMQMIYYDTLVVCYIRLDGGFLGKYSDFSHTTKHIK